MTMINADGTEDKYPIRTIIRRFYPKYLELHPNLPYYYQNILSAISKCKTGELGYNVSQCEKCGFIRIHAISCNNRNCPCCQQVETEKWEAERNTELIEGIAYYHVVITVPQELNALIMANKSKLLSLMFKAAQDTLLALCADPKFMGAKPGIMSVLHTWGQKLNFHPHLHMCISGGGITPTGRFVETAHRGFFLPLAAIASGFRGRYLTALKKMYEAGELKLTGLENLKDNNTWHNYIDSLYNKQWLPFVKETFNGNGNAIKYLARYSYRTAISNSRITAIDEETVSFKYKDYADNNKEKIMTVNGVDFIGMFLQHILPSRFNRVRFSGYLSNSRKDKNLKLIHSLRNTIYQGNRFRHMNMHDLMMELYNKDTFACPCCSGRMLRINWLDNKIPDFVLKMTG